MKFGKKVQMKIEDIFNIKVKLINYLLFMVFFEIYKCSRFEKYYND